jgi:alpha-D-xyloside xylohydrolase
MTMPTPAAQHRILRRTRETIPDAAGLELRLDALPAIELPGTPGWLTGEPLVDQGVEVAMPNLPRDLPLPGVEAVPYRCRLTPIGDRMLRLVLAPEGARELTEPLAWLGIVCDEPRPASGWQVETTPDAVTLTSPAGVSARVGTDSWTLTLADGGREVLTTAHRLRQVAGFPMAPPVVVGEGAITLQLELGTDEDVYGFGEQFGRLARGGQELVLHTEDALGTGTGMAYKPVPVWHSTSGYLGFLNTGAVVRADVGHRRPSVFGLTVDGDVLDVVFAVGSDPAGRLEDYTSLTGRAAVPPLWAFGYWMGRCRYHSRDEMLDVADTMRALNVPADVLHVDPDWLVLDRLNTDFIWNTDRFGDLGDFCSDLHSRDFRVSVWEVPYLDPRSPVHADAEARGFLLRGGDGQLASLRGTPTPDGLPRHLVDFANPAAKEWWQELHRPFLDAGVDVFKTDFGEGCPDVVEPSDGVPTLHAHNLYTLRYNGAVYEGIARITGRPALVWGRSGWAGSQRFPGQWGGDAESTVAGLQATVRGGLSYACSAPGLWSHDIGGFFGPELTPGLYARWTQVGALSPLMRAHGLRPREPWAFGEQALEICRDWIRFRYSLLPYLWQAVHACAERGVPILRPLWLEFPDDPGCRGIDGQFMLGDDLLVVPVFDDGTTPVVRRFYVPEGTWTDVRTGAEWTGPGYREAELALSEMPVLARAGAVVPRVATDGVRSTNDLAGRPWEVHCYGDAEPRELVGFDGRRFTWRPGDSGPGWQSVSH